MGRQTAFDIVEDNGAGQIFAPEPGHLPTAFQSRLHGTAGSDIGPLPVHVKLDSQNVCISRLENGTPTTLIAPIHAYSGVMVQIEASEEPGAVAARIILKHSDPQFCVVLIETDRPEQLATSWPAWATALSLPMLVCDTGGEVKPIEAFRASPTGKPNPRRKLALLTGRRPRFLVLRHSGHPNRQETVYSGEREIIARN
ncbi:DUF6101 family protein [Roseibium algae]|uniref:DUF6101 family protein n=1 Tax=Roseibium algae TaxID=3123038 RepID=A0ABU8THA1_9HYPH